MRHRQNLKSASKVLLDEATTNFAQSLAAVHRHAHSDDKAYAESVNQALMKRG